MQQQHWRQRAVQSGRGTEEKQHSHPCLHMGQQARGPHMQGKKGLFNIHIISNTIQITI